VSCSEVQGRLSSFYDHQLSHDGAALVATHVANCSSCVAELVSFQQLSELTRRLTDPPAPACIWEELQAKLEAPVKPRSVLSQLFQYYIPARHLALAATILVAVGMVAVAYQTWFSPGYDHLTVNFAHYLEEFTERPDEAQRILLAKYDGRSATLTEATKILGYEPVAAKGLPLGYSLEKVHLLTMPCHTCAQVTFTNKAGESIVIFEYAIDQPVWFGDRPTVKGLCHDIPTSVMQVGDRLVATWREGKRYVTIIGATDLKEVNELVAHFSEANSARR